MRHTHTMAWGAALLALGGAGAAQAQDNVLKLGITRYTTHSSSGGLAASPAVFSAPADAHTGNATTLILVYERSLTPQLGAELVLGIPPRIKARGTGAAAPLGEELLSAKNVSPTLLVNWYFGAPDAAWRPYLGGGINYTRFVGLRSSLATQSLTMSDSWGLAVQAGLRHAVTRQWGLFGAVTRLDVKSTVDAVATIPGVPVPVTVKTRIDLAPLTYTLGSWYRF